MLTAGAIMTTDLVTSRPNASIEEAIDMLLSQADQRSAGDRRRRSAGGRDYASLPCWRLPTTAA